MDMTVLKDISDRSSLENGVAVMDEIRQDGKTVLSSSDGISIPMVFRNLSGRNFSGKEYRNYLRHGLRSRHNHVVAWRTAGR